MTGLRTIVASPHVNDAVVDGQVVLFSHADRFPRLLNETAARIFLLARSPMTELDIVEAVARAHSVDTLDVAPDVCRVLDALIDDDLCRVVDACGPVEHRTDIPPARSRSSSPSAIGPISALGCRVNIDVPSHLADLREQLSIAVDPLRSRDLRADRGEVHLRVDRHGDTWTIHVDDVRIAALPSAAECRRMVLSLLNTLPLESVDDAVVLHAAGASVNGVGVVFPGESGAGKSTLVAQLVGRGHGYLTDEAVAIDLRDLVAEPFPKPIRVEPGAQRLLAHLEPEQPIDATWDVDPRSIEPNAIAGPAVVERIIFPEYRKNLRRPILREVAPIDALIGLLRTTFDFQASGQEGFRAIARLAETVPAHHLIHGGHGQLEAVECLAARASTGGSPSGHRIGEPRRG